MPALVLIFLMGALYGIPASALSPISEAKERCTEVHVDTTAMGPPRNQGNIGWCYAHSAADLVSFKLGKRISAIDLAMNYKDGLFFRIKKKWLGSSEFDAGSGDEKPAIEASMAKGFCAEEDFRGDIDGAMSTIAQLRFLEKFKVELDEDQNMDPERVCARGYDPARKIMKDLSVEEFAHILFKIPRWELFQHLRGVSCKERIKPPGGKIRLGRMEMVGRIDSFKIKALDRMDVILNRGQPLALGFDVNMIQPGRHGAHSNNVVGRRFNEQSGECEYQLRNTWNKFWGDGGYMWVTRKAIFENGIELTYLK